MDSKPIYKTAAELGIEQWERDGLAELVPFLSRGDLRLDMSLTNAECGTAACVGGWIAIRRGLSWRSKKVLSYGNEVAGYVDNYSYGGALHELYYPSDETMHAATAPQAARAIVNFLVTGDPRWDDIMAGES